MAFHGDRLRQRKLRLTLVFDRLNLRALVVVVGWVCVGGGGADVMLDMCVCPYIPAECT